MTRILISLSAFVFISCSDSPETDNRDSQVAAPATCMADQSGCKPDSDANSTAVEDVVDAERTKALRKSGRVALPLKLARVWSRVGTLSDSVLFQPADITADEKAIYLSDFSGGRIIALKMETGEVSWTFGRMGDGPGEFRGLSSFAAIRGDTITIWNRSLSRVTELSTSGHLIGTRQINAASRIFTLCVLKDGTLVSNRFMGVDSMMIATAAPTGDSLQLLMALPWKEIRGAPAIAAQFVLHSLGDGSCLLTPLYWSGAVRFADGRLADSLRIVETVPVPEAAKRPVGASQVAKVGEKRARSAYSTNVAAQSVYTTIDAAQMSDYTVIGFAGATAFKRRLLDFYATKTGGYVGSYILDGEVRSITAVGNRLAVISEDQVGLFRLDIFRAEPPALERD